MFLTLFVELIEASLPQISRAATELGVPFSGCDLHCIALQCEQLIDQINFSPKSDATQLFIEGQIRWKIKPGGHAHGSTWRPNGDDSRRLKTC